MRFLAGVILCAVSSVAMAEKQAVETPPEFKVAFVGDQGLTPDAEKVLRLIRDEGAQALIHQGDLDYANDPAAWEKMMDANLGKGIPVFVAIGNHDKKQWPEYQARITERLKNFPEAHCEGEIGISETCTYKGLYMVISGIGTMGKDKDNEAYLKEKLAQGHAIWKICNWHKNMRKMQAGLKGNETGWDVYEICRKQGAMITTGHEHSYSRTHLLSDFKKQKIAAKESPLKLEPGKSLAIVSGLGGKRIRSQWVQGDWFAAVYTSKQNATHGALFCTYHVDGNPRKAHCQFKNIEGEVADDFTLESAL